MTTSIKPISYGEQYAHLYEQQSRIEDNHTMEIEEILLNVCDKDRDIQFSRKRDCFNLRYHSQDSQLRTVNEKTDTLLKPWETCLNGISVCCHVASAFFGGNGNMMGGIANACGNGFSTSAGQLEKVRNAKISTIDHHNNRYRENSGELSGENPSN